MQELLASWPEHLDTFTAGRFPIGPASLTPTSQVTRTPNPHPQPSLLPQYTAVTKPPLLLSLMGFRTDLVLRPQ